MPKRVIDFDAMWGSDKLASCAEWAQAEYAWLYGLADASGCFELTNLRVIWGRVAAIRRNLTIERLEQIFDEFQVKGLLFVWEHEGKRYGHWSGSDVPGRLPAPSWRMRLERLAPPVPKRQFAEYISRFARGRAALAGGGFGGKIEQEQCESSDLKFEISQGHANRVDCRSGELKAKPKSSDLKFEIRGVEDGSDVDGERRRAQAKNTLRQIKDGIEQTQAQDWNSDWESSEEEKVCAPGNRIASGEVVEQHTHNPKNPLLDLSSKTPFNPGACRQTGEEQTPNPQTLLWGSNAKEQFNSGVCRNAVGERRVNLQNVLLDLNSKVESNRGDQHAGGAPTDANRAARAASAGASPAPSFPGRDKSDLLARELAVGRGPVCGPVKVNPKALERMRAREAARRAGSRSP